MARTSFSSFRRTATSVVAAAAMLGMSFTPRGADAQTLAAATPPVTSLAEKCESIKAVFITAKKAIGFTKDYEEQLRTFFKGDCRGTFPVPIAQHDIKNVRTASFILKDGGGIDLGLKLN